jgi:type II secretory pathway component PulF
MGMLFSARISLRDCGALCRRLATALMAGVDVRKVFSREAQQGRRLAARRHMKEINSAIDQGESLGEAVAATGDYFPPLFKEMVEVGEQTGHQGEIFTQLAEHFEYQLQLRRNFLSSITWPIFQLSVALAVVGFLIWIGDFLGQGAGKPLDFLGFGLTGIRGLAIYLALVAGAAVLVFLIVRAANRGLLWVRPIQRGILYLPAIGPALQTLALARLAWSMHLTMNAGMELRKALRLSFKSSGNAAFIDQYDKVDAAIAAGDSIYEAFCRARCFPGDFLDMLQVGEHSGTIVESMAHLSKQYREQARSAIATLTMFAGFAIWAIVAAMIIFLIFRLFSFYSGMLNGALNG